MQPAGTVCCGGMPDAAAGSQQAAYCFAPLPSQIRVAKHKLQNSSEGDGGVGHACLQRELHYCVETRRTYKLQVDFKAKTDSSSDNLDRMTSSLDQA